MTWTISSYIVRRFGMTLLLAFGGFYFLVVLGDLIELSRKASNSSIEGAPLLSMAMLHAPSVMNKALPFVVLLASLAAFLRLARSSELVVTRAAGISAWRLLTPPVLLAIGLGIFAFAAYNPIAATALSRYEALELKYFKGRSSLLAISREGLWLRQAEDDGQTVIHALRANPDGTELIGATFFVFDTESRLVRRIQAQVAALEPGQWALDGGRNWSLSQGTDGTALSEERFVRLTIPTELTANRILESFADPESLSFWDLQGFIETLEASGFSSTRHRLYQQTEMAKPLLFAAMVLLGAAFSMRHARFGRTGIMVLGCVLSGFGLFFISDITQALGSSGAIPVILAAWVPPMTAHLMAMGLLLFFEDG
ncbi:MAG: LPS export ABC transporter permease LptG [Pseudomonadota bacterium]